MLMETKHYHTKYKIRKWKQRNRILKKKKEPNGNSSLIKNNFKNFSLLNSSLEMTEKSQWI